MGPVVQRPEFFSFATYKLCEDRKFTKSQCLGFLLSIFFVLVVKKKHTHIKKCITHRLKDCYNTNTPVSATEVGNQDIASLPEATLSPFLITAPLSTLKLTLILTLLIIISVVFLLSFF